MSMQIIIGAQWGDEGKGKIVDMFAQNCDFVCRFNGGDNAGHTVVVGDETFKFHILPCGILNRNCKVVIGNGCVVNIDKLNAEIEQMKKIDPGVAKRVFVSERARVIEQDHLDRDRSRETALGGEKLGTTMRGIGPCYQDKIARTGRRMCDVDASWFDFVICDTSSLLSNFLKQNKLGAKKIVFEGANATMLDVDHGTWPFCTSSNCVAGQVSIGLGIAPKHLNSAECVGVIKAYTTRSGSGPFPTEDFGSDGQRLQELGHEFGTTTGRRRRCGWLDLMVVEYANRLNGFSYLVLNKLDVLDSFQTIKLGCGYKRDGKVIDGMPIDLERIEPMYTAFPGWNQSIRNCKSFDELPENAQKFVTFIEECVELPIKFIGTGPDRTHIISRDV